MKPRHAKRGASSISSAGSDPFPAHRSWRSDAAAETTPSQEPPRRGDFQGIALLRQPGIEFERKIGVPGVLSRRDVFLPEQLCEVVGRRAEQRVGRGDADAAAEVERSLFRFYAKGRRDDFGGGGVFPAGREEQAADRKQVCKVFHDVIRVLRLFAGGYLATTSRRR